MRPVVPAAILYMAIALAGCGGISYAMNEYSGVEIQHFDHGDDQWRIFDRPDANKLMITASIARSSVSGAVLGADGRGSDVAPYQAAANAYLKQRGCKTGAAKLVLTWQYEFAYSCK